MVDVRPGRRVAHRIIMNIEHMPCRRARRRRVGIIARKRDEGMVRVCRVDCDPAHEARRRR